MLEQKKAPYTENVHLSRLHYCLHDFMHLLDMRVAEK